MTGAIDIRVLATLGDPEIAGLCDVLIDCVAGGAFRQLHVADDTREGGAVLAQLGSWRRAWRTSSTGRIRCRRCNRRHRVAHLGTVGKSAASCRCCQDAGASRRASSGHWYCLVAAAERKALRAGKTVLVLDTVTGADAERLYARLGWQSCGVIPNYALWPDGRLCDTTVFFKLLAT